MSARLQPFFVSYTIAAADFAERERDLKLGEEHLSIAKQQLKIDQD